MGKIRKANFEPFESRSKNSKYARITKDMISSEAWQQLDVYARLLYLHIKFKYSPGKEKDISFTYKEGQELMSKAKFTKSLDKLIEVGLIDLQEHWRFGKKRNIFALSSRWHMFGTKNFNKQMRPKFKSPNPRGK